jgi:carboxypeptidase T
MLKNYPIMVTRYFVEIAAPSKQALIGLQKLELDLFQPTSKANVDENKFTIEGLITLEDVGKLVEKGYSVLVKKQSTPESPAILESTSFRDWVGTAETRFKDTKKRESASFFASSPGYLTTDGIDAAIQHIARSYPSLVQTIVLPHKTHEDRRCRAIKIRADNVTPKSGILFLGGVHAREIVNPDTLVNLALNLCHAYTTNMVLIWNF